MKKILLLFVLLFLVGCGDSQNLEDVSLLVGSGIDAGKKGEVHLTQQIIIPSGGGGSEATRPSYKNYYTKGTTIQESIRDIALKTSPVMSNHQRVLIFSKNALDKYPLDVWINEYIRDDNTRRSALVFVTRESAKKILSTGSKEDIPANKIFEIANNKTSSNKILKPITLGQVSAKLQSDGSFAVQGLKIKDGDLSLDGVEVIDDGKPIGHITPKDVSHLNWLIGDVQGGTVPATYKGEPISFEIFHMVRKEIKTKIKNGKLHFDISLECEGRIAENWYRKENSFKKKYLEEMERAIEKQVKKDVEDIIHKLQTKYKTGVAGLYQYVQIQNPKYWKKHNKEWGEKFSEAEINYDINIEVIDFGTKGSTS
ncbi:Ger(x)C family spore germination protein [Priestia filamentosa]|uniref:Ger(x)C family spore germination protein n=1 Tax=Priestia filamentosa TaxID=1402861 RepID=UPI00234B83A8|nr:Ger(x)C family spore germination protein [Priestia filamentosa]WCM17463.1 Ger(x)C family spore germination protein [Priestia filamentosa]